MSKLDRQPSAGPSPLGGSAGPLPAYPAAPRGPAPIVIPEKMRPTGILFRILEVDATGNNRAEGVVRPGAIPFWQVVHGGTWNQLVTSGTGAININGQIQTVRAGQRIQIPAETPFALLNQTRRPWRYQLTNPSWGTSRFSYQVGSETLAGDEVWFKMHTTPDGPAGGPTFRLAPATQQQSPEGFQADATLCIACLNGGDQTATQQATTGSEFVTVVSGDIAVGFAGTRSKPRQIATGETIEIPSGTGYYLVNLGELEGSFMIEPNPPRVWLTDSILWDFGDGNLQTGDHIWFEIVLPL